VLRAADLATADARAIHWSGSTIRCVAREAIIPCLVLGAVICVPGCGSDAELYRESSTGGLVTYPFASDSDVLASAGRRDAMELIRRKCGATSRILKEGELPKVSKSADRAWRGQMMGDRIWGIQFSCE